MQTVLALAVVGGIVVVAALHWGKRRRLFRYVQGRESLSDSQFGALFASVTEGQVGLSIRGLLKGWTPVDVSLIRPDDEFCDDLLLDALDGLDPEEFLRSVEAKWSVRIPDDVAESLRTVRQLSAEVARRIGGAQSNKSLDTEKQLQAAASPLKLFSGQLQRSTSRSRRLVVRAASQSGS